MFPSLQPNAPAVSLRPISLYFYFMHPPLSLLTPLPCIFILVLHAYLIYLTFYLRNISLGLLHHSLFIYLFIYFLVKNLECIY